MKKIRSPLLLFVFLFTVSLHVQLEAQWTRQRFPAQLDTNLILPKFDLNTVLRPVPVSEKERAVKRLIESPYMKDSIYVEEDYDWQSLLEEYSSEHLKEDSIPDYIFLADMNGDDRKDIIMSTPYFFGIFYKQKWHNTYRTANIFPSKSIVDLEFNHIDRSQSLKKLCLREYRGKDHYDFTTYTCSGFDKEFSRDSMCRISFVGDDLLFLPYPLHRQGYVEIRSDYMKQISAPPKNFPDSHQSAYYGAIYAKDSSNGFEEWLVLDEFGRLRWHDARKLQK
jgi:hypothetical protein